MAARVISVTHRPDSAQSISALAETALRRAGAVGRLPTPIDELIAAAELTEVADPTPFLQSFLRRLPEGARAAFRATLQKVRGIADLRERAIYVPADTSDRRLLFTKCHEFGHQTIPWHKVNTAYQDNDLSLSAWARDYFDQEANLFAADIIFQGKRFSSRARDFRPSFEAVFTLADEHGASRHATLWRYTEEQDDAVAMVTYWPNPYALDTSGHPSLRLGKVVGSPRFLARFGGIQLPPVIASDHPWATARDCGTLCGGEIRLPSSERATRFQWQAWWNSYSLFVLLRRRPALGLVGSLARGGRL